MRPIDKQLLGELPVLRRYLLVLAGFGVLLAAVVLVQAEFLAALLVGLAGHPAPVAVSTAIAALATVVTGRCLLTWYQGRAAAAVTASVKSALRKRILSSIVERQDQRAGELATLAGKGVDAVDGYLTGYLPQLVVSVTVPIAVIARLFAADLASALVIVATLPLIPVFAILVGLHTKASTARQWRLLSTLGGHFLDMVTGLRTLKVFGRARAQAGAVRSVAGAHADATMRTLRVTFLSALVLELVATLSVALVAVPIGFRLLDGTITAHVALLVLLLAPEAYLPLRAAGSKFHASAEGLAVVEQVRTVARPPATTVAAVTEVPDLRTVRIEFRGVTVRYPGRATPALSEVDLVIEPGERIALTGPSGAGKSTVLAVLLGLVRPDEGAVLVGGTPLVELDLQRWREALAWVPQRPTLFPGSIADNIALGRPSATAADLAEAGRAAELAPVIERLPDGYRTTLGEGGAGLSSGQRQRIGLARALLRTESGLLLLDEPTSRLDGDSEAAALAAIGRLATGRTALLVAHRPALLGLADRVVELNSVSKGARSVLGSQAVTRA
ncbi:thiol reductant ABC exporter subunit CydD [Amycolatopsis taiwanensis]|uniref:thiol reductant ABC exporter subunit CydD n=1 Tax=Amycolatopsis taiwanensis TaxID=342230 RepID=UPI0004B69BBB|nr:thiol reductant ABC exporter subunit CydD [Amycolatopsis taiwanensis]